MVPRRRQAIKDNGQYYGSYRKQGRTPDPHLGDIDRQQPPPEYLHPPYEMGQEHKDEEHCPYKHGGSIYA